MLFSGAMIIRKFAIRERFEGTNSILTKFDCISFRRITNNRFIQLAEIWKCRNLFSFLLIELVILKANFDKLRLVEIFSIGNLKLKFSQFFFVVELMICKQIWWQFAAVKILSDTLLVMTNYWPKLKMLKSQHLIVLAKLFGIIVYFLQFEIL